MTDSHSPRAEPGNNVPPLDPPQTLLQRLEREHAALFTEVSVLRAKSYELPEAPENDAEAAQVSDYVVDVKKLAKRIEDARTSEGRPYLEGTRIVNALFGDTGELLVAKKTGLADRLTERVGIYNRAKAEREAADRRAKAAEEQRKADEARAAQERAQHEADEKAREAERAAAAIRAAKSADERKAAEAAMRVADKGAADSRREAAAAGKEAAGAERRAHQNERAAAAPTGALGRVSAGGSTSSVTQRWTYRVTDRSALWASLGPIGGYLAEAVVLEAIARAVSKASTAGNADTLVLPGCEVYLESHTNIRGAR